MRRLETSRRFAGLIAVLVLAAGITAASAQPENGRGHGKRAGLELTYTKWFAPGFPHMVGVVGGDIDGQFGGAVLNNPMPDASRPHPADGHLHRPCPDASRSLTIRVEGARAVGHGRAQGPRRRRVAEGRACTCRIRGDQRCEQSPNGPCFQGTISIKQRDNDRG